VSQQRDKKTYTLECTNPKCKYKWESPKQWLAACPYCGQRGAVREVPRGGKLKWKPADRSKKFKYTYRDLARLRGVTIHAVRAAIKRKILDPKSLESVVLWLTSKKRKTIDT
jgi:hypothetical protein